MDGIKIGKDIDQVYIPTGNYNINTKCIEKKLNVLLFFSTKLKLTIEKLFSFLLLFLFDWT